jgi:hypothetical protein
MFYEYKICIAMGAVLSGFFFQKFSATIIETFPKK